MLHMICNSRKTNSWKIPISLMIQAMKTLDAFLILKINYLNQIVLQQEQKYSASKRPKLKLAAYKKNIKRYFGVRV